MLELIAAITAVIGLTSAIVVFLKNLKQSVNEVHVLVNSRIERALQRIDQLEEVLRKEGIEIPRGASE